MNNLQYTVCGFVVGAFVTCLVFAIQMRDVTENIKQCEKDLARSQKCVLIAIPSAQQKSSDKGD